MGIDVQKCLLVQSRFSGNSFYNYSEVARFLGAKYPSAPLGLTTVAALLPHGSVDPIHKVTIIPRGRAGGYTMALPLEDKYYMRRSEMIDQLAMLLGGRTAEEIIFIDPVAEHEGLPVLASVGNGTNASDPPLYPGSDGAAPRFGIQARRGS